MLTRVFHRLSQSKVTLVLSLLVLFTAIHSSIKVSLQNQVETNLQAVVGTKTLQDLKNHIQTEHAYENAAPLYTAAYSLSSSLTLWQKEMNKSQFFEWVAQHPQQAQAYLDQHSEVFELLQKAHHKPNCNYEYHWQQGFEMTAPNYIRMRQFAQLLALKIEVARLGGDTAQFNQIVQQSVRWLRTTDLEHTVIGVAIQNALTSIVVERIEEFPAEKLAPETRRELGLLQQQLEGALNKGIEGDVLMSHQFFQKLRVVNNGIDYLRQYAGKGSPDTFWSTVPYQIGGQVTYLYDEVFYLRTMKQMKEAIASNQTVTVNMESIRPYRVAETLIPNLGKLAENHKKLTQRVAKLSHTP